MLTVGFKKCCKYRTYSIFGVFRFLRTSIYKASKKFVDFLERGKTYVVYLQNFVLFYTEYVLTKYSKVRKKTKFRTFLDSLTMFIACFLQLLLFSFLRTLRLLLPQEHDMQPCRPKFSEVRYGTRFLSERRSEKHSFCSFR